MRKLLSLGLIVLLATSCATGSDVETDPNPEPATEDNKENIASSSNSDLEPFITTAPLVVEEGEEVKIEGPSQRLALQAKVSECYVTKEQLNKAIETQLTILPNDQLLPIKIQTLESSLTTCKGDAWAIADKANSADLENVKFQIYKDLLEKL